MSSGSVACVAVKDRKILIAHRNPTGVMGNRWEFPGGKVEDGESEEQTVIREFEEEFGISVRVIEKITESEFEHHNKKSCLYAYLIEVPHDGMEKKYPEEQGAENLSSI